MSLGLIYVLQLTKIIWYSLLADIIVTYFNDSKEYTTQLG